MQTTQNMDPLSLANGILSVLAVADRVLGTRVHSLIGFTRVYGAIGVVLSVFGSSGVWRAQFEVLAAMDDEDALKFQKLAIDECNMTAITGAIIAQLVITSLSLNLLNMTHWTARGFLVYSLVSSLMAVYFAATQSRKFGRLFTAPMIRSWIRKGRPGGSEFLILGFRSATTIAEYVEQVEELKKQWAFSFDAAPGHLLDIEGLRNWYRGFLSALNSPATKDILRYGGRLNIKPSVTSILAVSAPSMLLSSAVYAFLAGIGVYLGFLYGKGLETGSGVDDNRNILVVYLVAFSICQVVYSIAGSVDAEKPRSMYSEYLKGVDKHFSLLRREMDRARERIQPQTDTAATVVAEG